MRSAASIGEDHINLVGDQVGGKRRQLDVLTLGITVFDHEIAAFGETAFIDAAKESRGQGRRSHGGKAER